MQFLAPGITTKRYSRSVRKLIRQHARFFIVAGIAGLALRLLFALRFPAVVDDSRLYADIAKNWLQYGIYGITNSGRIVPTLSRLPGYPAFLAIIFGLFGKDNFRAVLIVQVLFDLATCFLIADLARRTLNDRAAKFAFLLAGLCPFLANYAGAALTETLEIFFTALALDLTVIGLHEWRTRECFKSSIGDGQVPAAPSTTDKENDAAPVMAPGADKGKGTASAVPPGGNRNWGLQPLGDVAALSPSFHSLIWFACGLAIAGAILLRPDGGILLAAVGGYLCLQFFRSSNQGSLHARMPILRAVVLLGIGALLPLVPWTIRNLRTLHRFEPLAPRYATDSDELVMTGFNRWIKTWMADYVSVQEIYWQVPDEELDASKLPTRAFDSPEQKTETENLIADYNHDHEMTAELDVRFAALASERVHASPLRYYLWLPLLRIADMWLRPRTELTSADPRWWEFNDDPRWIAVSLGFGLINLLYVGMAAAGLVRSHEIFAVWLLVLFLILRSSFLGTLENPEPRYTLECFPALILLASALFRGRGGLPNLEPSCEKP